MVGLRRLDFFDGTGVSVDFFGGVSINLSLGWKKYGGMVLFEGWAFLDTKDFITG